MYYEEGKRKFFNVELFQMKNLRSNKTKIEITKMAPQITLVTVAQLLFRK